MKPAMKPMMIYQRMCNIVAFFGGVDVRCESSCLGLIQGHAEPASDKGCSQIESYLRPRCELNIPKPLFCFALTRHHSSHRRCVSRFSAVCVLVRSRALGGRGRSV